MARLGLFCKWGCATLPAGTRPGRPVRLYYSATTVHVGHDAFGVVDAFDDLDLGEALLVLEVLGGEFELLIEDLPAALQGRSSDDGHARGVVGEHAFEDVEVVHFFFLHALNMAHRRPPCQGPWAGCNIGTHAPGASTVVLALASEAVEEVVQSLTILIVGSVDVTHVRRDLRPCDRLAEFGLRVAFLHQVLDVRVVSHDVCEKNV
jgi:hypothetical protein